MIHAPLSNGLTACVIPNDFIGRSAYYFGDVDPKITRTLQRLLAPGDTLVDIGANMGIVSLQAWRYVGPTGRVIAVEPQPVCCHAIRESVALNELTNVELHPIGLSNRAGRFDLYVPDASNLGTASLEPIAGARRIPVEVREGSEFLASVAIRGAYSVKIDVEGHEQSVIQGCESYFRQHPPTGLVFESHARPFTETDTYRILRDLGYRLFALPKTLLRLTFADVQTDGATDFVAIR